MTTDTQPPPTLWKHADFVKLWAGQTLAMFGAQIVRTVLPLVAVILLDASATEMGVLSSLSQLPFLLFLFAGVWADRVRRRQAMIWTDLGRFALLGLIPVLYLADWLTIQVLWVVIFVIGVLGVMFETAYHAYLPALVGREFVAEGNQKLELSRSTAQFAGPGIAGLAVNAVASAMVLVASTLTYVASAVLLWFIRRPDEAPPGPQDRPNAFKAIGAGLSWVLRHPVLRTITTATAVFWFFYSALQALYVLYLVRDLSVPAGWVAAIFAAAGPGAMVGSWMSIAVMKRLGLGRAVVWGVGAATAVLLLVPLSGFVDAQWLIILLLAASQFGYGMFSQIGTVIQTTLRQVLTPDDMQGRVVASLRAMSLAMVPVGALLGGVLADVFGVEPVLWAASIGALAPVLVYATSVIPGIRELPSEEEAAAWAPETRKA
ncbi:MFS transporter [Actinophytocola gossypii]|uniref:MFS transporter n=1 Tax=Actinophytocola gossypii TaxID=2812003 RepID=A0ABT2J242_9PSEU|nr:MFS transporter [Actinophytocola gossypii]MCT2581927.1 MFS transporter [Actinophytocola gossypii]